MYFVSISRGGCFQRCRRTNLEFKRRRLQWRLRTGLPNIRASSGDSNDAAKYANADPEVDDAAGDGEEMGQRDDPQSPAKYGSNSTVNQATKSPTAKNYASFTPSAQTNNLKIIADTLGTTNEEKAGLKLLFAETKKGFEAEAAKKGMKNNIAAAMTFLIATTVTVYHDAPEPSDEATENLFFALNAMFDEMPEMAGVPNKDKQFLYDTYISFSGLTLAGYMQSKEANDKATLKQFQQVAGSLLQEILKIDPNTVSFEGNTLKLEPQKAFQQPSKQENTIPRTVSGSHTFVKQTTNFNDGWVASPTEDYVKLQKNGTEIRLFYVRNEWDNYPNTVQHEAQYWSKAVTPYFNVSNARQMVGRCNLSADLFRSRRRGRQTDRKTLLRGDEDRLQWRRTGDRSNYSKSSSF